MSNQSVGWARFCAHAVTPQFCVHALAKNITALFLFTWGGCFTAWAQVPTLRLNGVCAELGYE